MNNFHITNSIRGYNAEEAVFGLFKAELTAVKLVTQKVTQALAIGFTHFTMVCCISRRRWNVFVFNAVLQKLF